MLKMLTVKAKRVKMVSEMMVKDQEIVKIVKRSLRVILVRSQRVRKKWKKSIIKVKGEDERKK